MGLRTKLRERLTGIIGGAASTPAAAPTSPVVQRRASAPEGPGSAPSSVGPAVSAPKAAAGPVLSAEEQAKQDKINAHFEKARRGVLAQLAEKGGQAPLADLHDYSERRYFIAHAAFSRMMEGFVAEGLLDFNSTTGEATLTEGGRGFLSA